jgi:hypothetical protein
MKLLQFSDYRKKQKENEKCSTLKKEKSHAVLLKEAFHVLDKVNKF